MRLIRHTSAIANDERGMERRNGFLVATIPKIFGNIVFEDTVAVDSNRSVLGYARETIGIAVRQRPCDIRDDGDTMLLKVTSKCTVDPGTEVSIVSRHINILREVWFYDSAALLEKILIPLRMTQDAKEAAVVDKEVDHASIVFTGIGLVERY